MSEGVARQCGVAPAITTERQCQQARGKGARRLRRGEGVSGREVIHAPLKNPNHTSYADFDDSLLASDGGRLDCLASKLASYYYVGL